MERFFKYPRLIVAVIAGITLFFGVQLFNIELDNNNFRFVPETDEPRQVSAYIDETFGSSSFILVGLERKYGTVFEPDFLKLIRDYVEQVSLIDFVGNVSSLVSSDYITGDSDTLRVEKLTGDDFTGAPEEIAALKQRLLSWDMYRKALISDDFTATQILIPLDITAENAGNPEVVDSFLQIRDRAEEVFRGQAEVYVTGLPVISATINESVKADLRLLVPLVLLVVVVIVFLPLRRFSFTLLSLLPVVVAVIWAIGAMPLFGVKLSIISTVLPVILIAVGNSYGLHLIIHYIEDSDADFGTMTREQHRRYILTMLSTLKRSLLLAALTTTVSFLSFCFTQVVPIREFGYFAGFGVIASFLITFLLIPALLIIRGPKGLALKKKSTEGEKEKNGRTAVFFISLIQRKKRILVGAALIGAVSLYGTSKVIIDNIFLEYFKTHTDMYKSEQFIREKFGGSKVVSIVVRAETPELVLHPDTLRAADELNRYLTERVPEVGKVMGFPDLIKRLNQVFNADEPPEGLRPTAAAAQAPELLGQAPEPPGFVPDFGFGFGDFFSNPDLPEPTSAATASAAQAPEPPPLEEPFTLKNLAALLEEAAGAGTTAALDGAALVWEVKRLSNYEGAAYYEIPANPARYNKTTPEALQRLIANYLVLLSGNISTYANDPLEPTAIKTTVQLRTVGQADTNRAVAEIHRFVAARFPPNVEVIVGGAALVEASLNTLVVQSLWTSILISLVFLFIIITVCNRSFVAGLLGVAPLLLLMLINFGVMGFLGIKLNIGTAMISSLTMGIGIDYTIHFLEAYKREYRAAGGRGEFLKPTYNTCGLAIIIDALATGAGFGVLLFSQFNMLADLGLLIMLAMLMSALVGLIIIPVLLLLIKPYFLKRPNDLLKRPNDLDQISQ